MTPSGYSTIGTILKIDGAPFAAARDITYPDAKSGVVDTTTLASVWKTKIRSGQIEAGTITVKGITTPTALGTMLAMLVAGLPHTLEIDFTTGDACTAAAAYLTSLVPGGASSGSPAAEEFTCTFDIDGAFALPAAATGDWFDEVDGLAIQGGDFGITAGTSPKTLVVIATVGITGFSFVAPNADLDFTSDTGAAMTVGLHTGIVAWVAAGDSIITAKITGVALQSEVLGTAT